MEETKLVVIPSVDKESGEVSLLGFEELKDQVRAVIQENSFFIKPTDDVEYKRCKEERKILNKKLKDLSNARKQTVALIVGEFESQVKALEAELDVCSKSHSEGLKEYEKSLEESNDVSTHSMVLKITCDTEENYQAIKNYAVKHGGIVEE